ncbi:MAG TPA: ATP-dependent 6-phosphofructokinase [Atribacteraceae bacterium]|nr:ATP-dependent 6-phosphofructokinase [Atribacteraceae bacterium]
MARKVGLLTGGGDAPGLNAVIRAVVTSGIKKGFEMIGFLRGWKGPLKGDTVLLTLDDVYDIHRQGGTILNSSRTNPFKIDKGPETIFENLKKHDVYCLVVIGGDDTLGVAQKLHEMGMPVVGVPKTIDNDVNATDFTFGFDTSVNIDMESLDRLHTTAASHERVLVVEIMGRNAGWIALNSGVAGGAHFILIPEFPYPLDELCAAICKRYESGKRYALIAAAEGFNDPVLEKYMKFEEKDAFGHVILSKGMGIVQALAKYIEEKTGLESRYMVIGHLQRGGEPFAFDRVLGTRFGLRAMDLVESEEFGFMVSLRGDEIVKVPLSAALGVLKKVPLERYEEIKLFFG